MTINTDSKRPPQWLALHFPLQARKVCLERLAAWCYQYSSQVCIAPRRNGLLLEVAASQRLFGDTESLAGRITAELGELGHHPTSGIAPTPAFLFPSGDDDCNGHECAPPPIGCVGVECFDPGFPNNPVRTLWTQDGIE